MVVETVIETIEKTYGKEVKLDEWYKKHGTVPLSLLDNLGV